MLNVKGERVNNEIEEKIKTAVTIRHLRDGI